MIKKRINHNNNLAINKKVRHDYAILNTYEAGIVLTGTEIKSVRLKHVSLKDGFIQIKNGQAWLENVNISPYSQGNQFNNDPLRRRKLLLHKHEINKLYNKSQEKGITIVPLSMYTKHGFAKVLIGLAKGKHLYDKRNDLKKRDQEREINRILKNKNSY